MPEVLNKYGFSFFFYSKEHEPIHIHVEGAEGMVVYDLIDGSFTQREIRGKMKANDIKRIEKVLSQNQDKIVEAWNKHFGEE